LWPNETCKWESEAQYAGCVFYQQIKIFEYLQDKNMFEVKYRHLLAGRYLRNLVVNVDAEKQMISKITVRDIVTHSCVYI